MPEVSIPRDRLRDPVGIAGWPDEPGRDSARTPMQWSAAPGGGFTEGGAADPWLPMGDAAACNVEDQERDPASILHPTRDLIRLRSSSGLGTGGSRTLLRDRGAWVWERGDLTVAANLSDERRDVAVPNGRVAISGDRSRDGERDGGRMSLAPWEAVVLSPD